MKSSQVRVAQPLWCLFALYVVSRGDIGRGFGLRRLSGGVHSAGTVMGAVFYVACFREGVKRRALYWPRFATSEPFGSGGIIAAPPVIWLMRFRMISGRPS